MTDWRQQARCAAADPTIFDATDRALADKAILLYCMRCDVRAECQGEAQRIIASEAKADLSLLSGTWGGRTYRDGRQVRAGRECPMCLAPFIVAANDRTRQFCSVECAARAA